jgi:molybdopterin-containing oxidoreductase family iron-sulfur binding subunit
VEDRSDSPEFRAFLETEFPNIAAGMTASTRRQFMKIMGASVALAGMTGCRWPKETIAPYAKRPRDRSPGVPVDYATAMDIGGVATGLLVKSYDGRPIKIEGNPDHPDSLGGSNSLQQASVLQLYDPDRSRSPVHGGKPATWDAGLAMLRGLRSDGGQGLAVLSEANSSPAFADARQRFLAACPQAQWYEYEALSRDNEREGTRIAFGAPYRTHIDFAKARRIVSFDSDFLMDHPATVAYTRHFARYRTAEDGTMSRLIQIESNYSLTGSNADNRYAERSSDVGMRLCQLGAELKAKGLAMPAAADRLAGFASGEHQPVYLADIAGDLLAHKGHAAIIVGPRQPAEIHAVAALLNSALGNAGSAVTYSKAPNADRATHAASIASLAGQMEAGQVTALLILGGNPAYDAPADLGFAEKLGSLAHTIHLSLYADETSQLCQWRLPRAHYLESWDLARGWDGAVSVVQPLIAPLYDGRTPAEILAEMIGDADPRGFKLAQTTFASQFHSGSDTEAAWRQALNDGLVAGTAWKQEAPALAPSGWNAAFEAIKTGWEPAGEPSDAFELAFAPDKLHDGRFANNGWLQELPHPMTKLTWDNAAMISPIDAGRLSLRSGDMIEIKLDSATLRMPVCVLPGHALGSITLPLGYGREHGGQVAAGAGFNTYWLRRSGAMNIAAGATVQKLRGRHTLATTQDHHAVESDVGNAETQRRIDRLIREGTLAEYKREPKFVDHRVHRLPLAQPFGDHIFPGKPRWAMAIDLTKCTGCSACVVACQAENNIPVVGKREVAMGREMHWIRIDRYFKGDPLDTASIEARHQPVACVHCENAPCEQVCPVAATTHDEEGLNVMIYNRCIGTRYCLNNCPYKVRRFNWFFNHHGPYHPRSGGEWRQAELYEIEKLAHNPEVTVRTRGVMEKCTYCIQRISAAKIPARNALVRGNGDGVIPDGTIVTACQQACPAEAIEFGDLNHTDGKVAQAHRNNRAYTMLEDLNIRTRTRYLAGLKNPLHDDGGAGHGAPGGQHAPSDEKAD